MALFIPAAADAVDVCYGPAVTQMGWMPAVILRAGPPAAGTTNSDRPRVKTMLFPSGDHDGWESRPCVNDRTRAPVAAL